LHTCCGEFVQALSGILDKKDWTLELSFHTFGLLYEGKPFDIDSSDWQDCKSRVRALIFLRMLVAVFKDEFDGIWLHSFLYHCQYIESLTLRDESRTSYFLRRFQLPKLRHLTICGGNLPYKLFPRFLSHHADTLESITFTDTIMSRYDEDVTDENRWDIFTVNPCWFNVLEIMLKMPRLTAVQLAGLAQDYDSTEQHSICSGKQFVGC
jgi:hypothetical protein